MLTNVTPQYQPIFSGQYFLHTPISQECRSTLRVTIYNYKAWNMDREGSTVIMRRMTFITLSGLHQQVTLHQLTLVLCISLVSAGIVVMKVCPISR